MKWAYQGFLVLLAIAAVSCLITSVNRSPADEIKAEAKIAKWEYKVVPVPNRTAKGIESVLKGLGEEGWEVANTISDTQSYSHEHPVRTEIHLVFKRPVR